MDVSQTLGVLVSLELQKPFKDRGVSLRLQKQHLYHLHKLLEEQNFGSQKSEGTSQHGIDVWHPLFTQDNRLKPVPESSVVLEKELDEGVVVIVAVAPLSDDVNVEEDREKLGSEGHREVEEKVVVCGLDVIDFEVESGDFLEAPDKGLAD